MAITGGTITYDGGYTVHTFTSSGTFVTDQEITGLEYLIVAGGGAGGGGGGYAGGGGGAGGCLLGTTNPISGSYSIVVGNGGVFDPRVVINGENSSAFGFTAIGGGGGGLLDTVPADDTGIPPNSGGSGGGGGAQILTRTFDGAVGTSGQGKNGGDGLGSNTSTSEQTGGGGGGAATTGGDGTLSGAGDGGNGIQSSISGTATYYAGGGGAGTRNVSVPAGSGGLGGGGNGGADAPGQDATPNTGGGGGAGGRNDGGTGGSGIVILRYPTPITNITHSATPATASADIVEPTIVTTIGDSVYVTTTIIVSADFPSGLNIFVVKNTEFSAQTAIVQVADLINNITITAGNSFDFSPNPMTANAFFQEEIAIPRSAMFANANFLDANVYVDPNYRNLIFKDNPVFYSQFDTTSLVNEGSLQIDNLLLGTNITKNVDSGEEMQAVGQGKSWAFRAPSASQQAIEFDIVKPDNSYWDFTDTENMTVEYWYYPEDEYAETVDLLIGNFEIRSYTPTLSSSKFLELIVRNVEPYQFIQDDEVVTSTTRLFSLGEMLTPFEWNYIALRVERVGTNLINVTVHTNSTIRSFGIEIQDWSQLVNWVPFRLWSPDSYNLKFDQLAIYDNPTSSNTALNKYSFIKTLTPDTLAQSSSFEANASLGNHVFTVTSSANYSPAPMTANFEFPNPEYFIAYELIINIEDLMTASANMVDEFFAGDPDATYLSATFVSNAEMGQHFALNTQYSDYVQLNHIPYRYVTFDGQALLEDYGSDADYSVPDVEFTGEIIDPVQGINGRSAKTEGLDYASDAIVFMESEYDDNWGTRENRYHSAFWFQKAEDDVSTGLRVLWNLNSAKDNQHIVVYYYNNVISYSMLNETSTLIETGNTTVDLFDGERHLIVIDVDHTGTNEEFYVYVDEQLVTSTSVPENAYLFPVTVNGDTLVGPNDPANNYPRLAFGGLITPFAETSLPVVPTNYKAIIDEPYFSKTGVDATDVSNLYNAMPGKENVVNQAEAMIANAEMIEFEEILTTVNFIQTSATANAEFVEPDLFIVAIVEIFAENFEANANMLEAEKISNIFVTPESFIASSIFNTANPLITIPGPTMKATASSNALYQVNGLFPTGMSTYVRYLRTQSLSSAIPFMNEVK